MKIFRIIFLIGWGSITTLSLQAQKKVPQGFHYAAEASEEGQLKELTQVSYNGTSSIRLYFDEVQLGTNSYILLEGQDSAQQKLNAESLKNWRNSSAYFNGQNVKVSLYQAAGEEVAVKMKELEVTERNKGGKAQEAVQARAIKTSSDATAYEGEIDLEETPWAAAVGRFTNGSNSYGTGWIAPNGAIVTSKAIVYYLVWNGYDIIEFNVPPSNPDGSVNHPGPEDQYPVVINDYANNKVWALFNFKRRLNLEAEDESGLEIAAYRFDAAIVEALPNSTGKRPGERQQQYFRIATNPGSFILENGNFDIDILHYGSYPSDLVHPENSRTLRKATTTMLPPSEYLRNARFYSEGRMDDDDVILYHGDGEQPFSSSQGSPITYHNSNVAIGVHHTNYVHAPAGAVGFANNFWRDKVDRYFTNNGVYVDSESLYNPGNGDIHKPYLHVGDGINHATDNAVIYIAKGTYHESVTIDKPLTLSAPVGAVVIGSSSGNGSRKAGTQLSSELFVDDDPVSEETGLGSEIESSEITSFPNPFREQLDISYSLAENTPVQIKVYDLVGNEVTQLLSETQAEGKHTLTWDGRDQHGVPTQPGMYIIRLQLGETVKTHKVLRQ